MGYYLDTLVQSDYSQSYWLTHMPSSSVLDILRPLTAKCCKIHIYCSRAFIPGCGRAAESVEDEHKLPKRLGAFKSSQTFRMPQNPSC